MKNFFLKRKDTFTNSLFYFYVVVEVAVEASSNEKLESHPHTYFSMFSNLLKMHIARYYRVDAKFINIDGFILGDYVGRSHSFFLRNLDVSNRKEFLEDLDLDWVG